VPKKTKPTTSETKSDLVVVPVPTKVDSAKPRSSSATPKAKKTPVKKAKKVRAKPTMPSVEPSDDEIRLRAYFISERRRRFDLAGGASSDWIEARRQLVSEGGPR
jgi:hypothetical protein